MQYPSNPADPTTGLPAPIEYPDGLVGGTGQKLADALTKPDGTLPPACGPASVPASSVYCHACHKTSNLP